jgi:hypothetical protein
MLGNATLISTSKISTDAKPRRAAKFFVSSALCASAIYLVINCAMQVAEMNSAKKNATKIGQTTVTQQAFDSASELLRSKAGTPTISLVGSSLVLAPFWSSDLRHFKGVSDCWHHHQALWLEQCLASAGISKTSVISFGLPGLVVSDAYLITQKLFKGPTAPSVVFYGIAPRDFMDDFLGAHTQTPVFERLVTVPDAIQLGDLYFSNPQERLDFVLQKVVYLYGKRGKYQTRINKTVNKACDRIFGSNQNSVTPDDDLRSLGFLQEQNRPYVWAASIREYKARYRTFNEAQFEKQKHFLDALLKLNHERGITAVLVNMPLTADNIKLMPPGLYPRYMKSVQELAARHEVALLDLQHNDHYTDQDFYDTVHLNALGGDKLASTLAKFVSEHGSKH